jgi:hypothetical protein
VRAAASGHALDPAVQGSIVVRSRVGHIGIAIRIAAGDLEQVV